MNDLDKVLFTEIAVIDNELESQYKIWDEDLTLKVLADKLGRRIYENRKDLFSEERATTVDATVHKLRAYVLSSEQLHELVKEEARIMLEQGWKPKEV